MKQETKRLILEKTILQKQIELAKERRAVVPKLERFRGPARYKLAEGGRGSGKSMSFASLIIQKASHDKIKVLCCREIQKSIKESVKALLENTIERLQISGWDIQRDVLEHKNGSRIIFNGLKDLRAATGLKSIVDVDICWIEEGQSVSKESIDILIPTIRKEDEEKVSEIWVSWNPETEFDPVDLLKDRPGVMHEIVNWNDNPWFPEVLRVEKDNDYKTRPDEAEHIWGGHPRKQGQYAVMSRVAVREAMDRDVEPEGAIEIGVDVARFGADKTVMYKRRGLKVIDMKEFIGQDTMRTALEAWDLTGRDRFVKIKVDDTGLGGGVTDRLREWGANVIPINFNGTPVNKNKYTSIADEMWFEFPLEEADIPDDYELMQELSGRQYSYDNKGRKKIEQKENVRKSIGRSPDKADALLLCYYSPAYDQQHFFRKRK